MGAHVGCETRSCAPRHHVGCSSACSRTAMYSLPCTDCIVFGLCACLKYHGAGSPHAARPLTLSQLASRCACRLVEVAAALCGLTPSSGTEQCAVAALQATGAGKGHLSSTV